MRRKTVEVQVGNLPMGGDNPVRVQSMTTVSTMDTEGCIAQIKRIVDAGGEYVRLTTQGIREAENLKNIKEGLRRDGYDVPIIADVHFNANVADVAALYADKVRINPGNYVDPARKFKHLDYTDEEYADEIKKIEERFIPFLNICKEHHTAIRIGVNHGSLSDRIMSRSHLCQGKLPECRYFHQGQQHRNHGTYCPSAGSNDGQGRYALPHPSWCHRSRRRRGRTSEECSRYWSLAHRWYWRHHSCQPQRST